MNKFAQYNKAIQAALGLVVVIGTSLLGMKDILPENISQILTVLFGVGTAIQVWWVKNEPLVSELATEGQALLEEVQDIVRPAHESLTQYVEPQLGNLRADMNIIAEGLAENNRMVHQLTLQANAPSAGRHSEEVQQDGLVSGSPVSVEGADDPQTGGLA